jgi:hypothetical protein
MAYGASSFSDDTTERNASQTSVSADDKVDERDKSSGSGKRGTIKRKPVPTSTLTPGEYPTELQQSPLLPLAQGLGERRPATEWVHLVEDNGREKNNSAHSDAANLFSTCCCSKANSSDRRSHSAKRYFLP